ncbi:MAG: hypothetical protein Q8S40_17840, partial [Falsiroseomonas sp.]|nr:hypothetical protein [Falsiroseomonas sp.]
MSLIRACRQAVTLLLGLIALATVSPAQAQATPPLIAGAADLQFAIAEIAATFRADTGQEVRLAMGSS